MTEKELREKIGVGENQLVNTSSGLVDIMAVGPCPSEGDFACECDNCNGRVTYGFLAAGTLMSETIEKFLERFEK